MSSTFKPKSLSDFIAEQGAKAQDPNADRIQRLEYEQRKKQACEAQNVPSRNLSTAAEVDEPKEAIKHDSGKPELMHIPPIVWRQNISELDVILQALSNEVDLWFYYDKQYISELKLIKNPYFFDMVKVLEFGAKKYASLNFVHGLKFSRVFNAFRRHLAAIVQGQEVDEESLLPHAGHALCCVLFIQTYILLGLEGGEFDDRIRL